jgi:electron transfer flavoprotein beta subunit
VRTDPRRATTSDADAAALEWALRCGEAWDEPVLAVTAGPVGADVVVREAMAAGAERGIRVELPAATGSALVARAVSAVLRSHQVTTVWCGAHSLDRGSGSVPAYLAASLGCAQALGLVEAEIGPRAELLVLRRLDGGRRERLRLRHGGVLSVEGASSRLRRASLGATLAARAQRVEVHTPSLPATTVDGSSAPLLRPYRPRARALPAPSGLRALDRIVELLDAGPSAGPAEVVALEPAAAAERILDALAAWDHGPTSP